MNILNIFTSNYDIAIAVVGTISGYFIGNFGGIEIAKSEAIRQTQKFLNENAQAAKWTGEKKLEKAVDFFYDTLLTKYVPNIFLRGALLIFRPLIKKSLQKTYDKFVTSGLIKVNAKLDNLKK